MTVLKFPKHIIRFHCSGNTLGSPCYISIKVRCVHSFLTHDDVEMSRSSGYVFGLLIKGFVVQVPPRH